MLGVTTSEWASAWRSSDEDSESDSESIEEWSSSDSESVLTSRSISSSLSNSSFARPLLFTARRFLGTGFDRDRSMGLREFVAEADTAVGMAGSGKEKTMND